METSLLKTLAGKHRSTVGKMAREAQGRHRHPRRAAQGPASDR
jgi:hypothetical protein